MNILIMGCSYGVPNYFGPPLPPEHCHIEFMLKRQGHTVHNCSMNGGSNLETLTRAKQYLKCLPIRHPAYKTTVQISNPVTIDKVIWFHTELFRDGLDRSEEDLARDTYTKFAEFFAELSVDIAVIGGAGDLHKCASEYINPAFCIPSWRRAILKDPDLPLSNTVFMMHSIPDMKLTKQEKLDLLNKDTIVFDKMTASDDYPDDCHPGWAAHVILVEQLNKEFLRG